MDLNKIKSIYFIGIGGIGMSAIARMLLLDPPSQSFGEERRIMGSDRAKSVVTEELEKLGVKIFYQQVAKNISADIDLVIYTIAISEDNPELKKARELGIECRTYPEMLGLISADKYTIAVAGTHGKTTTTAMIAKVLIEAKLDPMVIVGSLLLPEGNPREISLGLPSGKATNFIAGQSDYFVVEACEYRRSFLNLNPKIGIITNIDSDHLDYYKDLADIQLAFSEFASRIPTDGFLICDISDPLLSPVINRTKAQIIDYCSLGGFTSKLELLVPGEHNIKNAQCALAVAQILNVEQNTAIEALKKFTGTWRRFEYKGQTKNDALVYDDYAHHPTEIRATIGGAREFMAKRNLMGKLIIAFQPHLYSRTKALMTDFAEALSLVDKVMVAKIYAAREPFDPEVKEEKLVELINAKAGKNIASFFGDFVSIEQDLENESKVGDLVVVMGAGDINQVANSLVMKN
ncbi:MAG: UDP-N-acetylmuramate-L-alanine ligase [Microgenomates group bacterium GW2011_GWC1_38_12]|nr:MAG: UDP-N-acetylmuramate-L-alanine ligase [Microgenomates group bacterium GW2011_GWC1_38_12]KKS78162.1 MAG: UDP-N-acetylmuramate-L-alanine ligase [Parcubacteria group bacterium GW2011_GWB1_42_9]